ncbi:hypothetical protein CTI12_AA624540 [Artemisia annua]|uniref:Uncharacterized protein n=1 Tax=Artemisia annua TaxID=35608 RepID=A0A2U1KAT8_ARTAN|nr:hypothetical protein CTI12_AA624540 [Artemisia annua]
MDAPQQIVNEPLVPRPKNIKTGVKFDMHLHKSKLTQSELDTIITTYNIPLELHPVLPDPAVTMAEFLELPDWEGTSFSVGEELPAGHQRPNRTTPPRAAGEAIPLKDLEGTL